MSRLEVQVRFIRRFQLGHYTDVVQYTEIHKPPPALADKLGYPRALVDHDTARKRAIDRYKNIGKA